MNFSFLVRMLCKSRISKHLLLLLFAFASLFTQSAMAQSGYNILSSTSVQFYANNAAWADAHYTINGGPQQNVRMTNSGNNNTLTITTPANATVWYFLTIANSSGGANDTAATTFTTNGTTTNPGGPSGYTQCAAENQTCNFSGTRQVAYGANGKFNYKTATGSIACTNAVFGDPISGTVKACYYAPTTTGSTGPAGYTQCAAENQTCSFSGTHKVAYGANGAFNYQTATNSIACNNATFGDPISGTLKACYYDPANITTGGPGTVNGTHKRLKIVNGCGNPMWVQWLTAPTVSYTAPNRQKLDGVGSFVEFDVPDKGLPSMRFWPGFGCDANGANCTVGASGGPASLGFGCPPGGCAPPIDSKFEASFGCIPGVSDGDCYQNPSAPGTPLGRGDWWNSSFVDGYTAPMKVVVHGTCPVGPQPAPVFGPGGPVGGVIDCSTIRVSDCPTNENLSTNGQFPALSNMNLIATNPTTGKQGGCYSAGSKLTFNQWAAGSPTYAADSSQAKMYSCPTPPVSPSDCSAGPASKTQYHNMVHQHCATYTYPYDDGVGLSSCPAATDLSYEVTFYCPQ